MINIINKLTGFYLRYKVKIYIYLISALLAFSGALIVYRYSKQLSFYKQEAARYESNIKYYEATISGYKDENRVLRLNRDDLRHSNDSMIIRMEKLKKSLKTAKNKPGDVSVGVVIDIVATDTSRIVNKTDFKLDTTILYNEYTYSKIKIDKDTLVSKIGVSNEQDLFIYESREYKNTYRNKIDVYEINKLLNFEDINYQIESISNQINEGKLELHRIELSKNNIMPQLEDLANIEEELIITEEDYENLMKKNNAMIVVKQVLESAYEKMKSNVTPKFTNDLSKNIAEISNGKYDKVSINDENGLMVELNSGEYVSAEKLSLGTIDQLYLSLRLSMNTEVSSENMPIILDEAFAYYDDDRLENILKYLAENYADKQIIILTCTNREEEIFEKLGHEFNKVVL